MLTKLVSQLFSDSKPSLSVLIKNLTTFYRYYRNLNSGINSGKIYHQLTSQSQEFIKFVSCLTEDDTQLLNQIFKRNVEEFLTKTKLHTFLDFEKRIGTLQIGYNTIYIEKPKVGLWTTGKAIFYVPTKIDHVNKITIEIFSIPPLSVIIGFENEKITDVNISKLSTRKIEFTIDPSRITKNVSEIYITTDKLWLPNIILNVEESIKIGIGIKSIRVSYL